MFLGGSGAELPSWTVSAARQENAGGSGGHHSRLVTNEGQKDTVS